MSDKIKPHPKFTAKYPYLCVYKISGIKFIPTLINYGNCMLYRQIGQTSDSGEWVNFDEVEFFKITDFIELSDINNETKRVSFYYSLHGEKIPTPNGYFFIL